ncbi:MAG: ATP-binding cassette domain-containing protein [Pseudomonadales bacterium]|nr:ATP-binding cassette domain-containing protein [Pseudomonadales bacterium]
MLLQVKNLSYSRGTKTLFNDLDLSVSAHDKIGLVGHNGCGKTSLLNLISGQAEPDAGERIVQRGLRIGLMEQFIPPTISNLSLLDAVSKALPTENQTTELWRAEAELNALGFTEQQFGQTISELSGGQQNLALFARARLQDPDLLLMDEPGNHMDVLALQQLKRYLDQARDITFIMISHDRELLDDCCSTTVFLRDLTTYHFKLPYSQARDALAEQDAQAQHRRIAEQKEIDRIRASSKRLAHWGHTYDNEDLARKAKTMALRAEKLEAAQTFVSRGSGLDLKIKGQTLKSKTVFTIENLQVTVPGGERTLLTCEHLVANPGDRIALLGANGTGKSTTILRLLQAHKEAEADLRFNPNVSIGYFDQELAGIEGRQSRFDWLHQQVDLPEDRIKKVLLNAGIAFEDFGQAVGSLSGGEKARLTFMLLALKQPSLMILDEPTNHIDLESREQLERQLIEAQSTLLITSHDRSFLQAVCNRFWLIRDLKLIQIDSLNEYYDGLQEGFQQKLVPNSSSNITQATVGAVDAFNSDPDKVLARIQQLEDLLAADRARKPKFQKPDRHLAWQQELQELWAKALGE